VGYLQLSQIASKYCLVCDDVLPRVWHVALVRFYHLALWSVLYPKWTVSICGARVT